MDRISQLQAALGTARRMTLGLVADIPPDRWTWVPVQGQNHVAWICMHLLLADDYGPASMGRTEKRWVERWQDLVNRGPVPDPSLWPSSAAILDMMAQAHARYLECLGTLRESDLERPTAGPLADFAPVFGTLVDSHVWHEGFHGGQISIVRKALRLPPAWG